MNLALWEIIFMCDNAAHRTGAIDRARAMRALIIDACADAGIVRH
jgi:hypothetical protein